MTDNHTIVANRRKLPPNDVVIALYRSGLSSGEIAKQFSVKPVTVISFLRRIGEPRRNNSQAQKLAYARGKRPTNFWAGKKQTAEHAEKRASKIRGKAHYLWKDGMSRRTYRNLIAKDACENCGVAADLGIHHKNDDHFDNSLANLQVLCNPCHMSETKRKWWAAKRAGAPLPKSNGPVGWTKKRTTLPPRKPNR